MRVQMKNFKSLFNFLVLVLITVTFAGCGTFFQKPDPELTDIDTKEEAFELMKSKVQEWNYVKGKVKLAIFTLPYEGHLDLANNQAYLEKTTKRDGVEVVDRFYYLQGNQAYLYELKSDGTEVYETVNVCERYNINLDLSNYLNLLKTENVNLENVNFEKDEYHIGLSLSVKFDEKAYDVEIDYGNSKFEIVVEEIGKIILEKDNSNFFADFDIDFDKFQ